MDPIKQPKTILRFTYSGIARACTPAGSKRVLAALTFSLLFATEASAQIIPPFYGGPVTAFDVEVAIIDSGTLLDAQAVVSHDQRYVTINARADNSSLLALREFQTQTVATAGSGFVGGVNPSGLVTNGQGSQGAPRGTPSEIDLADRNAASILNRRGVHPLSSLK